MGQAQQDYYDVLGISRDADAGTIKQAFRERARVVHPDVSRELDADGRFIELAQAYSVLSHPTRRLLYDRFGYVGAGNGGLDRARSHDASDAREAAARAFDFAEVQVEFLEALRGATREVEVATVGLCTTCGGSGTDPASHIEECARCRGEGRIRTARDVGSARVLQIDKCADCGGIGRVVTVPCPHCLGSGRATIRQKVKVDIPAGAEDRRLIRAEAEPTDDGRGARRRDVYIVLRIVSEPDSRVLRYGSAAGLILALALFVVLLVAPESLGARF